MENLSKRDKVIVVCLAAALVCFALYYFVIGEQNAKYHKARTALMDAQDKLDKALRLKRSAGIVSSDVEEITARLALIESGMASGDLYMWATTNVTRFANMRKLRAPYFRSPSTNEFPLLAEFPYLATTVHLNTVGNYHDLGKFVADVENNFPYALVRNVSISSESSGKDQGELLRLELDLVALVNTLAQPEVVPVR